MEFPRRAGRPWLASLAACGVAVACGPSTPAEPGGMPAPVGAAVADGPGGSPQRAATPPRNTGPAARAHSRTRRGRHGTTRIIRRTPEVMREDAARVRRGDLFSTWSNDYLE